MVAAPPNPLGIREPVQFDVSVVLGADPWAVFALISDFPALPTWMPLMKRVEVDDSRAQTPGGVGAVRVIYPLVGKPTLETVKACEPPRLLAYGAGDASLMGMYTDHTGVLTVAAAEPERSLLRWVTYANPGRNPPMRWLGRAVFAYVIRASTRALQRRFPLPR